MILRCAAIDVGTNTVKMIVADLGDGKALRVFDESDNTRLGEGLQANGSRLREAAMRRTIDAIARYVDIAGEYNVAPTALVSVGTAALRTGENRDEFVDRVRQRCGLTVDVIAGEEEARLSYLAVRRDPSFRSAARLRVIDIGGGSTEVIQGAFRSEDIAARISVPLGAVSLTERLLKSDPPTIAQLTQARDEAARQFAQVAAPQVEDENDEAPLVVGVGGTMTNLAAINRGGREAVPESMHNYFLSGDGLEAAISLLASQTIEQRKALPGLDPRRADIILGGAILLSQALARIEAAGLYVSTRGLRWGLLYDRFQR